MKKIKLPLINSLLIGLLLSLFYIYSAEAQTTIRIGWWGGNERNSATLKVIKLFEQKYPDIKVKAEYGPFNSEKFTSQYIGGKAPDIMQVDFPWLSHFANSGEGFYDIYQLKNYGLDLSGFTPNTLKPLVVNKKLMGLPFAINRRIIVMSRYYLDKYNLPLPQTWDDYKKLGMLLKEKEQGKVSIMFLEGRGFGYLFDIIYPITKQMFNKDLISSDKKLLITEQELTKVIDFYLDLLKNNVYLDPKKSADAKDETININKYWLTAKVFTTFSYPAGISIAIQKEGINSLKYLTTLPIPQIKKGETKGIYNRVAFQWGVKKNTQHPQEVTKFLNFYFNNPDAVKAMKLARGVPVNKNSLKHLEDAHMLSGIAYKASKMAADLYANEPAVSAIMENKDIEQTFDLFMQRVSYGKMTSQEAAKKIIPKLELILKHIR